MLYGYKIVDGRAVVDKPAQKKIQLLFQNYLAGMSLSKAAEKADIHIPHGMVVKLLSNQHYLGDNFYPQLIDKSTFEKAAVARRHRAEKLGRTNLKKPTKRCPWLSRLRKSRNIMMTLRGRRSTCTA